MSLHTVHLFPSSSLAPFPLRFPSPVQMANSKSEEKESGAAQPAAKTQGLALLNQRSAKIGTWELYVYNPQVLTYEWTNKRSQEVKSNQVFRAILVDRNDPASYCLAEYRKKPTEGVKAFEPIAKKMKDGLGFRLTRVALHDTKQEYIHSPKKVVINLAASKLDPILATGGSAPKPVPAMTNASTCQPWWIVLRHVEHKSMNLGCRGDLCRCDRLQ